MTETGRRTDRLNYQSDLSSVVSFIWISGFVLVSNFVFSISDFRQRVRDESCEAVERPKMLASVPERRQ